MRDGTGIWIISPRAEPSVMTILLPEDYRESIGFTEDLKESKHVLVDAVATRGLPSSASRSWNVMGSSPTVQNGGVKGLRPPFS